MSGQQDFDMPLAPGAIGIAVGDEKGKVHLAFSKPLRAGEPVIMDPENARMIGEQIARAAYTARYGVAPPNMSSAIKAHTRDTLIKRFVLVDQSLREQNKPPAFIAQTLVDLFLSEVS